MKFLHVLGVVYFFFITSCSPKEEPTNRVIHNQDTLQVLPVKTILEICDYDLFFSSEITIVDTLQIDVGIFQEKSACLNRFLLTDSIELITNVIDKKDVIGKYSLNSEEMEKMMRGYGFDFFRNPDSIDISGMKVRKTSFSYKEQVEEKKMYEFSYSIDNKNLSQIMNLQFYVYTKSTDEVLLYEKQINKIVEGLVKIESSKR